MTSDIISIDILHIYDDCAENTSTEGLLVGQRHFKHGQPNPLPEEDIIIFTKIWDIITYEAMEVLLYLHRVEI